ncbi:MAG: ABC transporter ATP-binding protein [Bacteroidales bacterium]|nr:ABC transporter ATP-binding protein [Bacteroidales bacterium]
MTVLEIKNLTKRYGNILAVDDLSLSIESGSVFGILGPNGSGKSTTLSVVLGIVNATSGTFSWFGKPDGEFVNRRIGAIIEQPNFYPYLTAIQNLRIVAEIRDMNGDIDEEMRRVLEIVDLLERKDHNFSTFSYGMKTRLALAASLLGNPDILVLDEPTNGLDPEGIAFVRNVILDEAKKGKTIIIASHILDEIEKVCTDVLILKNGKLLACGKVSEVLQSDAKVYIKSDDNKKLHEILVRNEIIESADFEEETMIVRLKKDVDVRKISELAMDNRIVITNLELKKKSLEDEFLELVKK